MKKSKAFIVCITITTLAFYATTFVREGSKGRLQEGNGNILSKEGGGHILVYEGGQG